MSLSTPILHLFHDQQSTKEKPCTEKERQASALTIQIQTLQINTFYNRDKRVFVKAFKLQFPALTIKTICALVGIKVSTYYYKPTRPYFQGYIHERKADPVQFSNLKKELKAYNLLLLHNHCKRVLVRTFKRKYPLLTIRKISQMCRLL